MTFYTLFLLVFTIGIIMEFTSVSFLLTVISIAICASNPSQDKRCSSHIPNGVLGRNCTGNVGSYCQVSCYHGYQLHNDVLGIYCNKDRRWSVIETKICQQVEENIPEKRSLTTEAVLGGAVTGFLSVCLTYIVIMMVKQKIKKINDNEDFSLHQRSIEQSRQNDYLETVAFVSSSRNPTTCVNEAEINRTEVKQDQEVRKPEESTATRPNDKPKIHLYHNVFRKGSYENV
ncbi:uncharacterized protein LOC128189855 [Crassostrea angulata]|uniref:uncharacterized protein LOC128189855 n=1 Tax=Magallana angulata TaxID=2784310 RepID=UPI0022B084BA|nr:uncharacterized protein LOC128189855 [Crassostrea angulata]